MNPKVKIADILEAMGFQLEEETYYLDLKTGQVVVVTIENLDEADGILFEVEETRGDLEEILGGVPDWQQEELNIACDIVSNDMNYVELPDKFAINEYRMMENFCLAVENPDNRDKLLISINGRGAFRRFKDTAIYLGLIDEWYRYRDESFKKIAIEFVKRLELDYIE